MARKPTEHHWPRRAQYEIRLDGQPRASSQLSNRTAALSELDYWARDGRAAILFRVELCPHPGCDGDGHVYAPRRGRNLFGTTTACPHHVAPETTEEARTDY